MVTQVQGFRLSPQQRHLWQLQTSSRAFRSQGAVLIEGRVDGDRLRRALESVIERHEILRTVYRRAPGIRFPIQVVIEETACGWQAVDLSDRQPADQQAEIDKRFQRLARRPFDLERGPLVQAVLLGLAADRHLLLLGVSALCADSRSLRNLVRELAAAYAPPAADQDGDEVVQYVQFSEWQNELLASEESQAGRQFWQEQSRGDGFALALPLEHHPKGSDFAPESLPVPLDPASGAQVDRLARDFDATVESVLLAVWQVLLWRLTGDPQVGVGVTFDGREGEELEVAQGLFARCLPIRSRLTPGLAFPDLVSRVEKQWRDADDWQSCFAAQEGETPAREYAACFELEEWEGPHRAGEVTFSLVRRISYGDRFKVCLTAIRKPDGLALELHYDSRWLERSDAETLGERLRLLLDAILADPRVAIGELEILTASERQRLLVDFNAAADVSPATRCLHRLFERQAARTPDDVALENGEERLTYGELNARANRLARHLLTLGIGRDAIVGVCIPRSFEMVVAILAVLKTEAAYLPLDATYPQDRIAFMIADARAARVLTLRSLVEPLALPAGKVFCLDDQWDLAAGEAASNLPGESALDSLAYVIYTSGSTGRPKGVMVPHRGVVNYVTWAIDAYGLEPGHATPLYSPISFDLTVTSLFAPLLSGGRGMLLPEELGVEALAEVLESGRELTLLKLTPLHLTLLGEGLSGDRLDPAPAALIVGGEALSGKHLAPWYELAAETRLINEYGPTETTVGCCVYEVPAGEKPAGPIPIGRPIAATRIYVTDDRLQPVPTGAAGEICVGGDGLARGYLGHPALTAKSFVPDPFGGSGSRLYRTGDLARLRPEAGLLFLGRNDSQVKIRGFRLELGEIEAVLASHEMVREAVVLAREDTPGETRLAAYVVAAGETAPGIDELRRFLVAKLPEYMVPTVFLSLPELPLTKNGKLDRDALPAPGSERPELEQAFVAPRNALEEILVGIWAEVLGIDKVGIHDSFFVLGGDSIRSVRAVALAKERGLEIEVQDLFRYQTVAELAAYVASLTGVDAVDETPGADAELDDLASLVEELEGLSEDAAKAKLREMMQQPDEAAS